MVAFTQAAACALGCEPPPRTVGRGGLTCPSQGTQVRPSAEPACLGSEPSLAPCPQGDLTSVPQAVYLQNGTNSSASLPHKSAVRVKADNRHAALRTGPRSQRARILKTVAFASINPGSHGWRADRKRRLEGGSVCRRESGRKDQRRAGRLQREGVARTGPWRKIKSLPGSLKAKSRRPTGEVRELLEISLFRVHTFTQQGFTKPFSVGSWGYRERPSQPRAQGRSGCRCSSYRTGGNTLLPKSRRSVHQCQTNMETVALLCQAKPVRQEAGGRAHPLKGWHSPRTQHKLVRLQWVQDGRQVNFS